MIDNYTRERLEGISVNAAITRTKVENMEKGLSELVAESRKRDYRLNRLERRIFTLWVVGPMLVGAATYFTTFKTWLMEH